MFSTVWPANVLRATAAWHFWTSHLQKVVRTRQFFNIFTRKYASRHSGVPFFHIGTSKMAPPMQCFVHFHLQMCFSPQPRAIFEHRNFQNSSANVVFCAFWLANVLFATAACHFSPVRETATSAPAALASLLFQHQVPRWISIHFSMKRRHLKIRWSKISMWYAWVHCSALWIGQGIQGAAFHVKGASLGIVWVFHMNVTTGRTTNHCKKPSWEMIFNVWLIGFLLTCLVSSLWGDKFEGDTHTCHPNRVP